MEQVPSRVEQTLKVREWIATGRARQLREAAGMSQGEVARDCNVDQQTVMRWEGRAARPRGGNLTAYYKVVARLEDAIGHTVTTPTAELAQV